MINKVKLYRQQRNLSQAQLADFVGLKRVTISMIEQERINPSLPTAMKLAQFFDVPVETLFIYGKNKEDHATRNSEKKD